MNSKRLLKQTDGGLSSSIEQSPTASPMKDFSRSNGVIEDRVLLRESNMEGALRFRYKKKSPASPSLTGQLQHLLWSFKKRKRTKKDTKELDNHLKKEIFSRTISPMRSAICGPSSEWANNFISSTLPIASVANFS